MARKPSVILSVSERKAAQSTLKTDITAIKDQIRVAKQAIKDSEAVTKGHRKALDQLEKQLSGLNVRHDALKPAPPAPKLGERILPSVL